MCLGVIGPMGLFSVSTNSKHLGMRCASFTSTQEPQELPVGQKGIGSRVGGPKQARGRSSSKSEVRQNWGHIWTQSLICLETLDPPLKLLPPRSNTASSKSCGQARACT